MNFWIKHILFLLVGIASWGGCYYFGKSNLNKVMHWERAPAMIKVYGSKARKDIASFTYNGNTYTFKPMNASGSRGTAIFPKDDPTQAELLNYKTFLMIPLFFALLGLILIAIGFFSVQNRIAGKNIPAPSHDGTAHFETLQNFATKLDEKREKNKES